MNSDFVEYSEVVGKILANLQSLEFSIRLYLHNTKDLHNAQLRQNLTDLKVGDTVPENSLTDWSTLGQLIDRYNRYVAPELAVDRSVVDVRDALAHCRMFLPHMDAAPILLKFDKPSSGTTRVSFLQVSSSVWLENTIRRIHVEIAKVQKAEGGVPV